MSKAFGFTIERPGTVIIFQSKEQFENAKIVNSDLKLITVIENDDLKEFKDIVITQVCEQADKKAKSSAPI